MLKTTRAAQAALILSLALGRTAYGGVIPLPAQTIPGHGVFDIGAATLISVPPGDAEAAGAARYLSELWQHSNTLLLPVSAQKTHAANTAPLPSATAAAPRSAIVFRREAGFGPEGYRLEVSPQRITLTATTGAGLFYAGMTLWQLLPPDRGAHQIAAQIIVDTPRFAWRGLMLDSARHFQSPAFIHSMIDWMAWHKLNVLHWHLTDDQGWRLQIRQYPKLTSVGGWRKGYGGFYTQAQVRSIVAHAATRHVQIVPEIEMPGHAQAAIAAYPALGVGGPPLAVSPDWGVHTHLFNLEPQTFDFLENVLAEVMQLFPSRYVHIGGDEAVKDEWNASPQVQARARELGIGSADALQTYFTRRIGRYLAAHGRRLVGWDEILGPGLPTDAVVMSWHGISGAHDAALAGNDAVLAPQPTLYFDRRQSTLAAEPPGRLQVSSLEDVYRFDPSEPELTAAQQQHVLGVQANIWTEHIQSDDRVVWMALPRAAALAEVAWSPPQRQWPDFLTRLVPMFARYRAFSLPYADSVFAVDAKIDRDSHGISVALSSEAQKDLPGAKILYSLDGRDPTADSNAYAAPLQVSAGSEIRAASFVDGEQASRTWRRRLDAHAGIRRDSHDLELCSNRIGLLMEPEAGQASGGAPMAIDIMDSCWIDRDVDLSGEKHIVVSVAPLPFNFALGADAAAVVLGRPRTPEGELEVHLDACDSPVVASLPLAPAMSSHGVTVLPAQPLPRVAGRHDLCLKFARPRFDPLWALDWVEIGE